LATPKRPSLDAELLQTLTDDALALEDLEEVAIVVPQLPAQTFVRIARHLREENRLELLLPFATPAQLTSLIDLDGWHRDRVHIPRARAWLAALVESYRLIGRPRGDLVETIYGMDPELWTAVVAAGTRIVDLDPAEDDARDNAMPYLEGLQAWDTPDGFFVVGVTDDEIGLSALTILSAVYEDDLTEGRKLCLSVQAALMAGLEEDLLGWRTGRLADLGFVEWEEAMRLFRPLDVMAAADRAPADFAYLSDRTALEPVVSWQGTELLRRIMGRLTDAEHGLRAQEFLLLVNEVMAAQRFEPGDEALQQRAIDQTQSTLSLGLELLASARPGHPDPEAFLSERVTALGLRDVFRVGYGALDKLRRAATTLHREGRISLDAPGSLLDRPWGAAIAVLSRWLPELPLLAKSNALRPIRGLRDVATATRWIAEAGALAQVCFAPDGYAIDPAWIGRVDEPQRLGLGDLIRTAIVHAHLPGGSGSMAPLTPDDVLWAHEHLLVPGGVTDSVRRDFAARCGDAGVADSAEALAEVILTRLAAELSALDVAEDGTPDLTRLGGFVTIQTIGMWLKTTRGID
jgi:hypothetical protein